MCDGDGFQRVDDTYVQQLSYIPQNSKELGSRISNIHSEKPRWKHELIKSSSIACVQDTHRNITLQEGPEEETEQESDTDSTHFGGLAGHYEHCEEVYRKKVVIGTDCIGDKKYFASVFVDPAKILRNEQGIFETASQSPQQMLNRCRFDSDFSSGNLAMAYRTGENQYELLLHNDINTKGNTQWFYFRITHPPQKRDIRISIVNLRKPDSLFNYGMLPCVHSLEAERQTGVSWIRRGSNVSYSRGLYRVEGSRSYYYTLSFTISTSYHNDVLRVAHCYPYTLTDLTRYLNSLSLIKYKQLCFQREVLVTTLGNHPIEAITIKGSKTNSDANKMNSEANKMNSEANKMNSEANKTDRQVNKTNRNTNINKETNKSCPLIIVLARQHPGETPGSFVCEGLIEYFLGKDKEAQFLRRNYEIKVIPMANPDGVVVGNYRTNLYGYDLNRRWDGNRGNTQDTSFSLDSIQKLPHESLAIRKYLAATAKGRDVAFVLDLHGHSRKLFSFFYGNPCPGSFNQTRVLPLLCSKLAPHSVRFEDSSFTLSDSKRCTARAQLGQSYRMQNVFTFEASFFGYVNKDGRKQHFTREDYRQLGFILGKAIYIHEQGKQAAHDCKESLLYRKCIAQLRSHTTAPSSAPEDSGSQSDPEEFELTQKEGDQLLLTQKYSPKNHPANRIIKRMPRRETVVKTICRPLRQLQVLDLARVHSIFPTDVIALIPNSYLMKHRKHRQHSEAQTEECQLLNIYDMYKNEEKAAVSVSANKNCHQEHCEKQILDATQPNHKECSNLFKGGAIKRPCSSEIPALLAHHSAGKDASNLRRKESVTGLSNQSKQQRTRKRKLVNRSVQTNLSFGCGLNTIAKSIIRVLLPSVRLAQSDCTNITQTAKIISKVDTKNPH